MPDVTGKIVGPVPSEDGRALQVVVPIRVAEEGNGWEELSPRVEELRSIAHADAGGLQVYVTGPAGYFADFASVFSGFDTQGLYITAAIVIVILLLAYRSPVLWILPIMCAGLALTAAQAVIYLVADGTGMTVNGQGAAVLTVLVFGAGTDYALLLIARYREELRRHADRHEAMAVALLRAGPAILASAATVVIAMLCLLFADMNSTKRLGAGGCHRHHGGPVRHADAAARPSDDLRTMDVLARQAESRLGGARRRRSVVAGRPAQRPPGPASGSQPPLFSAPGSGPDAAQRERPRPGRTPL